MVGLFRNLGVTVGVIDARKEFFAAFNGITDPEEKREAVTPTFYREVFGRIINERALNTSFRGLS